MYSAVWWAYPSVTCTCLARLPSLHLPTKQPGCALSADVWHLRWDWCCLVFPISVMRHLLSSYSEWWAVTLHYYHSSYSMSNSSYLSFSSQPSPLLCSQLLSESRFSSHHGLPSLASWRPFDRGGSTPIVHAAACMAGVVGGSVCRDAFFGPFVEAACARHLYPRRVAACGGRGECAKPGCRPQPWRFALAWAWRPCRSASPVSSLQMPAAYEIVQASDESGLLPWSFIIVHIREA